MLKIRLIAALGCLLLLAGCGRVSDGVTVTPDGTLSPDFVKTENPVAANALAGYLPAAANEKFTLYYEEEGLTIAVRENATGRVLTSAADPDENASDTWKHFVDSGIVVDYYVGKATVISRVNLYSGKPDKEIFRTENGFAAKLNFKSIGLKMTVAVSLTDSGLEVTIPSRSIEESNERYSLAAIWAYPFLGYTHLGDTAGYMLIPDGCGALIPLQNNRGKYSQPYKSAVYGYDYGVVENAAAPTRFEDEVNTMGDPTAAQAPVFGMVHTDDGIGVLGIVEHGDCNAELYAYPNGVITDYNWITARYLYRQVYLYPTSQTSGINTFQKERETFDVKTRYEIVTGKDASYVGLAKAYREYLKANNKLPKNSTKQDLRLDFFGADIEKAVIGTSAVAMTTVSQVDEILQELDGKGVNRALVTYKGWQKGGIYGNLSRNRFENALGSRSAYEKLAERYPDMQFLLYADPLNAHSQSGVAVMRRKNGRLFSENTDLTLHKERFKILPDSSRKILERLDRADTGLAIDGLTRELYSYTSADKTTARTRKQSAVETAEMLTRKAAEKATVFCSPNSYLWPVTQNYADFPLYGSDYKFTSEEVPFFAIVLKGSLPLYSEYVNFKADSTEYLLLMIQSGVFPSFVLTYRSPSELIYTDSNSLYSSDYREYTDLIARYNEIFTELDRAVGDSVITDFEKHGTVSKTVYANHTAVYVNFGAKAAEADGLTVEPHSYRIEEGKAS